MKTYKYWTMILAIGAAMAAPLYGCGSDDVETNKNSKKDAGGSGGDDTGDNGDDTDGGDNGDGGEGGEGGDGGSGGDGGNGGDGPVGDEVCATKAAAECVACCEGNYPTGSQVYNSALNDYFCGTPGVCATECADTLCKGQNQVTQDCYNCAMGNQQGAQAHLQQTCGASQECVDFNNNCLINCPQQ